MGRGVVGWGRVKGATAGPANSTNPQARIMTDTGGAHPTLTALGGAGNDRHANLRGAGSVVMTKAGNEEGGEAAAGRVATPITTRGQVQFTIQARLQPTARGERCGGFGGGGGCRRLREGGGGARG